MFATPTAELLANPFRLEQFDELTLKIADRLGQIFSTSSQFDFDGLEIEAKFGIFKKKDQSRLEYSELEPGYIPLAFLPNPPYQFITEVPPKMFTHLRDVVLNGRVNNFNQFKYEPEIKFVKTHTIDETYILPDGQTKVRVTKDAETGDIIACITKQDLSGPNGSNINILNNGRDIDCRISARREVSVPVPESNSIFSKREKKRSSYHVGMWSIDMTEIPFTNSTTQQSASTYEIEVEFLAQYMPMLRQAWDDYQKRVNANFIKIIRSLFTTVQTLVRLANPSTPLPQLCQNKELASAAARKLRKFDQTHSAAIVALNQGGLAGESRM